MPERRKRSLTTSPRCPGCGLATEPSTEYPSGKPCVICEQKPRFQSPVATRQFASQGEPPYRRSGNFRDLPANQEE